MDTGKGSPIPRWKSGVIVALIAMAGASAVIWIPWPSGRLVVGVGALAFLLWNLRDPAYFFMRAATSCLGTASACAAVPAIHGEISLPGSAWGRFVLDSSPWGIAVFGVAGVVFGWFELKSRGLDTADMSEPSANRGAATQAGPAISASKVTIGTIIHNQQPAPVAAEVLPTSSTARSNLPRLGDHIVSRPAEIAAIHAALKAERSVGVSRSAAAAADGGYGKTILGLLYAHKYADEYPGGRFVISCEQDAITGELAGLAPYLGIDAADDDAERAAAVGAYMKLTPAAEWSAFADALREGSLGLMHTNQPRVASQIGYQASVVDVLDAAFDAQPREVQRALEYSALLPPDLLPREWLTDLLRRDSDLKLSSPAGVSLAPGEFVIAQLTGVDLLRPVEHDDRLLSMHRAHRSRVAERLAADGAKRERIVEALVELGFRLSEAGGLESDRRWELSSLAALSGILGELGRYEAMATIANRISLTLRELGRYGEARANIERAIKIEEKHLDPDHPKLAIRYSNLATVLQDQGDLPGARSYMERANKIGEKHFDLDHPTLQVIRSNLTEIERAMRKDA